MVFVNRDPHGTLATILTWIPIYTPFTMMNRAAADPPLMEMVGATLLMIATATAAAVVGGPDLPHGHAARRQPPEVRRGPAVDSWPRRRLRPCTRCQPAHHGPGNRAQAVPAGEDRFARRRGAGCRDRDPAGRNTLGDRRAARRADPAHHGDGQRTASFATTTRSMAGSSLRRPSTWTSRKAAASSRSSSRVATRSPRAR